MRNLKKRFVLLLGICLFSSCGSLPKKPQIEICAHDEPAGEAECYDNQTQAYRTISIIMTDRYIMFSPEDWGLVLLYIDRLERRLREGNTKSKNDVELLIADELKKIKNASELLQRP